MIQSTPKGAKAQARGTVRVAVYVRQSVTRDQDGDFGSIEAQTEMIESYVASQRGEGWTLLPDPYIDRDASGATLDRPAFQRLLHDIQSGEVGVVVVYKIDRLSRSLADFARMIEFFEQHGVAFVSVTQQFNSASSVGKLTLNILMSFAEFERQTIAERTRDKMCAARQRGKWTGGPIPLGYDVIDRRLVVNDDEADQIRLAFRLYLELGGLVAVASELRRRQIRTKTWTMKNGKVHEGRAFDKATVRQLLANPIYVGRVGCKGEEHTGEHEAIIDERTWDAVQAQFGKHMRGGRRRSASVSILQGMVWCDVCGAGMHPTSARKGARRYRYFACGTAQKQGASTCPRSRIAVGELEAFVLARVRDIGRDPELLAATIEAAHEGLQGRRVELATEITRLESDRDRLAADRNAHEEIATKGGRGTQSVRARLRETKDEAVTVATRLFDLRREHDALNGLEIDDTVLASLLERFDPLWDELFPREKARVFALLIDQVRVDAPAGEIEIRFRPDGIRTLTEEAS